MWHFKIMILFVLKIVMIYFATEILGIEIIFTPDEETGFGTELFPFDMTGRFFSMASVIFSFRSLSLTTTNSQGCV